MTNNSELMTLANSIRKELVAGGMPYKDAQKKSFALAKERIGNGSKKLYDELAEKMQNGVVRFTHKNKNGREITTIGTLVESRINKRAGGDMSKIPGRRTAKSADTAVYFDMHHGFYRPVIKDNIVKIW